RPRIGQKGWINCFAFPSLRKGLVPYFQGVAMRLTRFLAVACLLLAIPACMSNNNGKIVGKWESTGGSALNVPGAEGAYMTLDFKADGAFSMGIGIQRMGII